MHAARKVEQGDRGGLERLCRYLTRPAAANDRFEEREDGRVAVRLKTPWRDGTTHILMTPLQLVEKLVALIPRPRVNMIRYNGAFAPNAAQRSSVVPAAVEPTPAQDEEGRDLIRPAMHSPGEAVLGDAHAPGLFG